MMRWKNLRRIGFSLLLLLPCTAATVLLAEPPSAPAPAPVAPAAPGKPSSGDTAPKESAPKETAPKDAAPTEAVPTSDADAKELDDKETLELLKVFVDSLDQIDRNYVKQVSRRELVEAAIEGMLERLDPYSSYIPPSDVDRFRSNVENQFGGIGIQVNLEDRQLKIVSPLVGTPAYRAGLMAGDTIVEIDGEPLRGSSIDALIHRLKGAVGTKVSLTVIHAGEKDRVTVTMTREIVHVESVLGDHRNADDSWVYMLDPQKRIAYIRITSFGRETAGDLQRVLTQLQKEKMRGLILDLRFNPGGLLTSAIETCDLFIDKGRIVSTKGRNTPERVWDAKAEGTFGGFPMAVLVNHYSASASEIVSACLQDHKRAVIVGERSWGKGSVQNVIDLEGGRSVLKLTTASYWRPSGKNIHRFPDAKDTDEWGVKPDPNFDIVLSEQETREMVDDRRRRDIVVPHLPTLGKSAAKGIADNTAAPVKEVPVSTVRPADPASTGPASTGGAPSAAPVVAVPAAAKPKTEAPLVDRQLKRAIEYLDVEVARAG